MMRVPYAPSSFTYLSVTWFLPRLYIFNMKIEYLIDRQMSREQFMCTVHFLWLWVMLKISTLIKEQFTWKNGSVRHAGHSFRRANNRQRHAQYAAMSANMSDTRDSSGRRSPKCRKMAFAMSSRCMSRV